MSALAAVLLLGPPEFSAENQLVSIPVKQVGLLALVAHKYPSSMKREYIARTLWPQSSLRSARHSLSQAIYNIRRQLGEDSLKVTPTTLQLGHVNCDLVLFRSYIDEGAYERAGQLLRGEFCEGIIVRGCLEFDQWLENSREGARQMMRHLLTEPLPSPLRTRISSALGHASVPDTAEASPRREESEPGFVGRVRERQILEQAWSRSKADRVTTALVTGEPGIGKTTLCTRMVKKSVLHGFRALSAAGYAVQRNLPYGIASQIIQEAHRSGFLRNVPERGLDSIISEIIPTIGSTLSGRKSDSWDPGSADHRFARALHHVLSHVAKAGPVTIFVDDIQWADSASLSILHYIAHCEVNLPIFLLFATRKSDPEFFTDGRWSLYTSISLTGLSLPESKLLVPNARFSTESHSEIDAIHEFTNGNPLLIKAFTSKSRPPASRLPPSAKQYFQHALSQLSTNAQLIGGAMASVGEALSLPKLAWVAEVDESQAGSGLEDLVAEGFAGYDEEENKFLLRHDVLGDAFLENLPFVTSTKLHGRTAKLFRDQGSPAAVVATKLTTVGNDAETCEYAFEAARASLRLYAYREAEHFLRLAIATAPTTDIQVESRTALSTVLMRQGRTREAAVALEGSFGLTQLTPKQSALLEAHKLIAGLSEVGPPSVPQNAFLRAKDLERLLPPAIAAKLFADIAGNAQQGLHQLLEQSTQAALGPLGRMEDGPERIRLEVLILTLQMMNGIATDRDKLDRLTRQSSHWPVSYAACLSAGAFVELARGRVTAAERGFTDTLRICEEYGLLAQRIKVLNNLGVCFLEQGRWSEAEQQFTAVLQAGGPVAPKEIPSALANLLILHYERGEPEKTLELGSRYLQEPSFRTRLQLGSLGVLGLAHMDLGGRTKARQIANTIRTSTDHDAGWTTDISYLEIFMARIGSLDGNRGQAEERLRSKIDLFNSREFYCASRMKVELVRSASTHSPERALKAAKALRAPLAAAHAAPLVEHLDRLIVKCQRRIRY